MNVKELTAARVKSAQEHDENTGEDNGDLIEILEVALETLKHNELIGQFLENLRDAEIDEIIEYEWLQEAT
jgi:hypothetical protein